MFERADLEFCTGLNARSPLKLVIKNPFSCDVLADFIFDWEPIL
jgi:hypothetical protein